MNENNIPKITKADLAVYDNHTYFDLTDDANKLLFAEYNNMEQGLERLIAVSAVHAVHEVFRTSSIEFWDGRLYLSADFDAMPDRFLKSDCRPSTTLTQAFAEFLRCFTAGGADFNGQPLELSTKRNQTLIQFRAELADLITLIDGLDVTIRDY